MELPLALDWTMDCPSASSSCSNSFSGSSLGEPLTPTSRRSTPPNFEHMFAPPLDGGPSVDVLGFPFASPAPGVSGWGYVDVDVNAAQPCPSSTYDGLAPMTPGPAPVDRCMPLTPACQYPLTPSRALPSAVPVPGPVPGPVTPCQTPTFYSFGDSFTSGPSPVSSSYGAPTPTSSMSSMPSTFYDCTDTSLIWSDCQVDNMFLEESSPLRINTNVAVPKYDPAAPPRQFGRAKASQEARRKTKVLHRAQAASGPAEPTKPARPARSTRSTRSTIKAKERVKREAQAPKSDKGRFKCIEERCKETYARKEHMYRHWNSKHNPHHEPADCWEPSCRRSFGRQDNLKPHLKLHGKTDRPQARVKYSDIACRQLELLNSLIGKRRVKKAKDTAAKEEADLDVDETGPDAVNRLQMLFQDENNVLRDINSFKTSTAPFKAGFEQAVQDEDESFDVDFLA